MCKVDDYEKPNPYEVYTEDLRKEASLYKMTYTLLNLNFERGVAFSFQQASDVVYPVRKTISKFKNKKSFDGTLNRELQRLRSLNLLEFTGSGWYTIL